MTHPSWIDDAANDASAMCSPDDDACGFCTKPGLRILPLRHSAFAGEDGVVVEALPGLPEKVRSRTALAQLKPAVRAMREGFLYVLIDRGGVRYWQGYHVLPTGQLSPIVAGERPAPADEDAFSCARSQHPELAMLVSIDRPEEVADSWWLFTPSPMTRRMLEEYRRDIDAHLQHGRVQHFSPARWVGGQHQARDTLLPGEVGQLALEYRAARLIPEQAMDLVAYTPEVLSDQAEGARLAGSLESEAFPPFRSPISGDARATLEAPLPGGGPDRLSRLQALFGPMRPRGLAAAAPHLRGVLRMMEAEQSPALVLEDPIGVTQEANAWRNAALELMRPWLQQPDAQGVDREWRFVVRKTFDTVRESYCDRRVAAQLQRQMGGTEQRMRAEGVPEDMLDGVMGWHEHGFRTRLEARAANGEFREEFRRKYLSRMDEAAMEAFDQAFAAELAKAELEMERRVDEVLGLLTSPALLAALHAYDREDLRSGWHFAAQTGLCVHGLGNSAKGAELIHGWWSEAAVTDANLAWRATALNQASISAGLEELLAHSQDAGRALRTGTFGGGTWDTVQQTVPMIHGLVGSFDNANAVLEAMPLHNTMLAGAMAWHVSLGQAFFRSASPNALDRSLHYRLDAILRATVGPRAVDAIAQRMEASGRVPDRGGIARGVERRMAHASNQSLWQRDHADIGKVRLVSALAFLEGAALILRARSMPEDGRERTEVLGAAVMTASAGFEILATYTETQMGRSAPGTANAREMRITYGGLKLWAAGLGSLAGGVIAFYDFVDARRSWDDGKPALTLAYGFRVASTVALLVGQSGLAIAASRELFRRLAVTARTSFVRALSAFMAEIAAVLSRQALQLFLVRMVLGAGIVGIAVTGLLLLIAPNDLEKWCDRSCFSKDGPSKPFRNSGEEMVSLLGAVERVV